MLVAAADRLLFLFENQTEDPEVDLDYVVQTPTKDLDLHIGQMPIGLDVSDKFH